MAWFRGARHEWTSKSSSSTLSFCCHGGHNGHGHHSRLGQHGHHGHHSHPLSRLCRSFIGASKLSFRLLHITAIRIYQATAIAVPLNTAPSISTYFMLVGSRVFQSTIFAKSSAWSSAFLSASSTSLSFSSLSLLEFFLHWSPFLGRQGLVITAVLAQWGFRLLWRRCGLWPLPWWCFSSTTAKVTADNP